jgi:hypothetical protein
MAETRNDTEKRPRIGLVHALRASIAPTEAAFLEIWPEAEPVSLYDQWLYTHFTKARAMTPELFLRIEALLRFTADTGAEAVLFTGSLFAEPVAVARTKLGIPVLTAYEAMIEEAFSVAPRPRLALLATSSNTLELMTADIQAYALAQELDYELDARHVVGARDALRRGDQEAHDELVARAASGMEACDALLLAQFSMAPVAKRIRNAPGRRLFTSPGCAVAKLKKLLSYSVPKKDA